MTTTAHQALDAAMTALTPTLNAIGYTGQAPDDGDQCCAAALLTLAGSPGHVRVFVSSRGPAGRVSVPEHGWHVVVDTDHDSVITPVLDTRTFDVAAALRAALEQAAADRPVTGTIARARTTR